VSISKYFNGFAFSQFFVALIALSIKCLIQWNKALPIILLSVEKKYKTYSLFGFVLSKEWNYTEKQQYLSSVITLYLLLVV